MTKEQFLNGVEFDIRGNYFKLDKERRSITRIFRSTDRTRVVMEDYHMNVEKIGRVGFEAYAYILGRRVDRKIRFEDLVEFKS
jgi:hypothetical protein